MGERPEGAGAAGALILSGVGAGEVVGRERAPVPTPVGGTGKGTRGRGGLGRGSGLRPSLGRGFGPGGPRVQWGVGFSFFFFFSDCVLFSVFFLFVYFLFCFISFKSI